MKIALLANGSFPTHPTPLQALEHADAVICCDGAFRHLKDHAGEIFVVGDGDSADSDALQQSHLNFVHDPDQETNDLTKAFHFALHHFGSTAIESICIIGATGLREDHTLGNISLLDLYNEEVIAFSMPRHENDCCEDNSSSKKAKTTIKMLTDHGVFTPVIGEMQFDSFPRQQVSIFSTTPDIPVTVSGLRYPIRNRTLNALWQGTLNAATGDTFSVQGGHLIVYQTYLEKA